MSIVMGLDQHRAQISAEWIDTITGEVSRARIVPADRAGVRKFLVRFRGEGLEVALEATRAGGCGRGARADRRRGALGRAGRGGGAEGQEEACQDRLGRCPASAGAFVDRPAARVVDPAGAHPRSPRPGPDPPSALSSANGVAAADALGALSPRVSATPQPALARESPVDRRPRLPAAAREQLDISLDDLTRSTSSSSRSIQSCTRSPASSRALAR